MDRDKSSYYFGNKPSVECATDLLDKAKTFYTGVDTNNFLLLWKRMWLAYYGMNGNVNSVDTHSVSFTGEQGELTNVNVNHFRNLASHIYVMITANRPTMEAMAVNTDYKSLAQTTIANNILNYYMREKKLEEVIKKAAELSIILGSAFVKLEWNATAGEATDHSEADGFTYEGDCEFTYLSPFDVVFDGTKESYSNEWLLVRTFKNKYSLMAKYPELADQIYSLSTKSDRSIYRLSLFSNDKTDDVPVYEFFHKRTEAVPNGRYMLFLDKNIVLLDGNLPYRSVPIFRIAPSEILGTPYGYTPMFDVLPICEAINSLYSTILTNQNAFGVQNVFVENDADISVASIAGGMNLMKGNKPPIPINLTQTPEEIFNFLEVMNKAAETISGVNSVARGAPEASLKSGTALALVQSMALQFVSGLQQSYVQLIEDVGTNLINILKDFATTPRIISLVGKNERPYLKEFTGEQLDSINRVIVTVGNPLAKSTAGRIQMVQEMTQMKLIKTPEQYLQVLNTGSLDVATEATTSQLMLIKKENEKLMDSGVPLVSPTDQHQMHISEHSNVLNDPDLRENPDLIKCVMDHIEMHLNALRTTDPQLLALLGQPSLMAPPPGAPGQGGGPPDGGQPPPQGGPQAPPGDGQISGPAQDGGEQSFGLPSMPKPPGEFSNLPTNAKDVIPQ
jgi:hypothetical protein